MANTYLTYTQQSPSTVEGQKFTLSMWVKKCANGTSQGLYGNTYSNTHRGYIYFTNGDYLSFYDSSGIHVETNRKFRDTNAWYHIVISADTTQGTTSDRIKFYINGVQETSFSTASYPTQNDGMKLMSTTNTPNMGRLVEAGTSYYLQGAISHAHLTQGYTYDASAFGETDTTTGEWKAKTSPSVTYGTNGFFILKDGNGITDQSGEGNNFTLGGGTLTDLKDNPDNVFATLNPLQSLPVTNGSTYAGLAYSNGNTTAAETYGHWRLCASTLAGATGKFYAEIKRISGGTNNFYIGVASSKAVANNTNGYHYGKGNNTVGYDAGNGNIYVNDSGSSYGSGYANGDIIGIALDVTNLKVYFSKNGVWQNSGVPTSGSTGTGAISLTAGEDSWHIGMSPFNTTGSCNFGNGYFGTTAITTNSGNGYSGAEGSSKFNYTVPTGYSALSTKGLNE